MIWAIPQYSRNQVDKAGFALADPDIIGSDLEHVYAIINNWRSAHSYPLNTFQVTLRRKVASVENEFIVAQRIKRLESIRAKFVRPETSTIQLSQMQDIGGCRAVVRSIANVNEVVEQYKNSRFLHVLRNERNYIDSPKPDGYRGVHLVYQYKGEGKTEAYDKLRIEVQLRTSNQHAWATAVEAVSIFTRQALKWKQGEEDWKRFFALMGSAIASIERTPFVPQTPSSLDGLIKELRDLSRSLNVQNVLKMYSTTINYAGQAKDAKYLVLELDASTQQVKVTRFTASASQAANSLYLELERKSALNPAVQVVLVSVDAISKLQRAYPNYFLDTQRFSTILNRLLSAKSDIS